MFIFFLCTELIGIEGCVVVMVDCDDYVRGWAFFKVLWPPAALYFRQLSNHTRLKTVFQFKISTRGVTMFSAITHCKTCFNIKKTSFEVRFALILCFLLARLRNKF